MSKEIEKMTAIYEKHKNTMYAVALKILKNPQDAEDAVHNAILPIIRNTDIIQIDWSLTNTDLTIFRT